MPAPLAAALGVAGTAAKAAAPFLSTPGGMSLAKINRTAEEFESVFLNGMFEEMFEGVTEDDPFGNGEGAAIWRSLQTEELARAVSRAGGIGLADHVRSHLLSLQETRS